MALITNDRVRDTTTSTGAGTITVSGTAPITYKTFSQVCSVNDTFLVVIVHQTLDEWEVVYGTYSAANQFTRAAAPIHSSDSGNAAISFSAGTKDCIIVWPGMASVSATLDKLVMWDGTAGNWKWANLASLITETGPTTGDYWLLQRAEDDIVKVPWAMGGTSRPGMYGGEISHSRTGNAETISIKTAAGNDPSAGEPVYFVFQDGAGGFVVRTVAASLSITINNTALMGFTNAQASRIWTGALDNSGTVELFVVNVRSGMNVMALNEFSTFSSTTMATTSDSAQVLYSTTGRTSKYICLLGLSTWESGLAAVGVWDTAPSSVILFAPGIPGPGQPVQTAEAIVTTNTTGSTTFPSDNTVPQNTEGVLMISKAFVPESAADVIRCFTQLEATDGNPNDNLSIAIFQSGSASAIGAQMQRSSPTTASRANLLTCYASMLAGVSTSITFTVRVGDGSGGAVTINDLGGGAMFGGVSNANLQITEIQG